MVPSFFLTNTIGEVQGLLDGEIIPFEAYLVTALVLSHGEVDLATE